MNFLQRLGLAMRIAKGELTTLLIDGSSSGSFTDYRYQDFVAEGFKRNWTVYACLRTIWQGCSTIKLSLAEPGSPIVNGDAYLEDELPPGLLPVANLIGRPNYQQSYQEFVSTWVPQIYLSGAMFIRMEGVGSRLFLGKPEKRAGAEMTMLRPDWLTINNNGKRITSFTYRPDGKTTETIELKASEVLMVRFPDPSDMFKGNSPLEAAIYSINSGNSASKWNDSLLKKSGVPAGVLRLKNSRLRDKKRREAVEEEFTDRFMGKSNAGGIVVVNAEDGEFTPLSHTPQEMHWTEGKMQSMREICAVLGVPSQLIGDPKASTFNNVESAEGFFYTNTVLPLMKHFAFELQTRLRELYDDADLTFTLDTANVPSLQENSAEIAAELAASDWLTINEQRERLGKDPLPIPEADVPRALLHGAAMPGEDDEDGDATEDEDGGDENGNSRSSFRGLEARQEPHFPQSRYPTMEARQAVIDNRNGIRDGYSERYANKLKTYWQGQLKAISDMLERGSTYSIDKRDIIDDLFMLLEGSEAERFKEIMFGLSDDMAVAFATEAVDMLMSGVDIEEIFPGATIMPEFDVVRPDYKERLGEDLAIRGRLINHATAIQLTDILLANSTSPWRDRVKLLEGHFDDMNRNRAIAIARTEIARADTLASMEGLDNLAALTNRVIKREWITARDSRVREGKYSHVAMDGQKSNANGVWENPPEGFSTRGPATDGPAGFVINCRCVAVAVFDE